MEQAFINRNFDKLQQPVKEYVSFSDSVVVPLTENGKCPFLQTDFGCAVYETRPDICKKFGDESHILMTCAYQDKTGKERSLKEWSKIERKQNEITIRKIKNG